MKIKTITSESNSVLKNIRGLHRRQIREKERLFLLEGAHCVGEALKKELELKTIVASLSYLQEHLDELNDLDIEQITGVEDRIFADLVTTSTSCGILAVAPIPRQDRAAFGNWQPRIIAMADSIQDPGNLGTLIRTAFAAQLGGLIILRGSVDQYNPKVVRAAAGALFALPILSDLEVEEALELLRQNDMRLIVCEASAPRLYFEASLADSVAIVLGNEGQGIDERLRAAADECISIPMNPGSESLNVAISGGIILFETLKQRLVANR